jgi:MFS superfamily sulfate permease-like transporter
MIEYDITTLVANILIGIGLGIGLVVFWIWRTVRRFEDEMRGLVRETIKEVEADMVGIVVEEEAGQLYFYRETDRQFLCQGTTLMEIRKRFNEQYPSKIAYLAGGDPALIERLKNELKTIKEQEKNEGSISV